MMSLHALPPPALRRKAILALGALTALAGCDKAPPSPPEQSNASSAETPVKPAVKAIATVQPALTRRDLLDAAAQAASDYALRQVRSGSDPLVGRSFSVRIAFGCDGPTPKEREQTGVAGWEWGDNRQTIRLALSPADWKTSEIITRTNADDVWEAVEGFWITHPWILSEACPAPNTNLPVPTSDPSAQTLGLAAIFAAGGSRVGRRDGRPYQYILRPNDDVPLQRPERGYRLLLEGRVDAFPSGRALQCHGPHPDQRPMCIVATRLDRVVFEEPDGTDLAEWSTN